MSDKGNSHLFAMLHHSKTDWRQSVFLALVGGAAGAVLGFVFSDGASVARHIVGILVLAGSIPVIWTIEYLNLIRTKRAPVGSRRTLKHRDLRAITMDLMCSVPTP